MFLTQTVPRQREIIEVVLRNGWDYMRRVLTGGKADEPQLPTPAVLKNILVDLGPVYVKLGQLLSTRPDLLSAAYIEELSTLQDEVPPVPWSDIEVLIRQQLKQPLEETFSIVNHVPVAAGSIAQTHRATLVDGREVALKVQRPGIDLTSTLAWQHSVLIGRVTIERGQTLVNPDEWNRLTLEAFVQAFFGS